MPISSTSFIRATVLLLLAGFIAVFAIVATAIWLADRNNSSADDLIDALTARRESFRIMNLLLDAETGQRGYLLTRDEAYLEPYRDALTRLDPEVAALRGVAGKQPQYAADIDALVVGIDGKIAELSETIELMQAGRDEEALAIVRTDRGKKAMDAVDAMAERLIAATEHSVSANTRALRQSAGQLLWVLAAGGFAILGIVGATSWIAWRYTRDLERARAEVMALNTTLEARVRERTLDVARANQEIQRFAYIVSHDLRSPLVNIMGFTGELEAAAAALRDLLPAPREDTDPAIAEARATVDKDIAESLGFIRSSTQKMDGLINAILRLSREGQRRLSPERVDMAKVFAKASDSVRHQAQEAGAEIILEGPFPDLVTDRLAVEQVFGNLVDNAIKYLDSSRPGRIVIRGLDTPMGAQFEVEDNGRGIADEDHERIFDLFRRAGDQDRPGEGIGLSHVRALVRRLGGTISLRSELGKGTAFRVRLPKTLTVTESEQA